MANSRELVAGSQDWMALLRPDDSPDQCIRIRGLHSKGLLPDAIIRDTHPVPPTDGCAFPQYAPSTAYQRGCRCEQCIVTNNRTRRELAAKRRLRRHPDLAEELARQAEYRGAITKPPFVTGPYSQAEDRVIIAWRRPVLELAVALGRTVLSVTARRYKLRQQGRMWT